MKKILLYTQILYSLQCAESSMITIIKKEDKIDTS